MDLLWKSVCAYMFVCVPWHDVILVEHEWLWLKTYVSLSVHFSNEVFDTFYILYTHADVKPDLHASLYTLQNLPPPEVWVCVQATCAVFVLSGNRVWWHSNQVLLHMFLVSAPCFPQRAGQRIASLVIGGLGRGHDYHLAHGTANMAGFLFHLPLKLNHFCAKIDCFGFA